MKLWAGRFQKETDDKVNYFNSSISFDARLYRQDITGSIAHATMLGEQGIIAKDDFKMLAQAIAIVHDGDVLPANTPLRNSRKRIRPYPQHASRPSDHFDIQRDESLEPGFPWLKLQGNRKADESYTGDRANVYLACTNQTRCRHIGRSTGQMAKGETCLIDSVMPYCARPTRRSS